MRVPAHGLIVLAAGASRRLGISKQSLRWQGETLLHRAARLGLATLPSDAVVVFREDAPDLLSALADLPIRPVISAQATAGMGASLVHGCHELHAECAGALILQVDQYQLQESHLHLLLQKWHRTPDQAIASAYAGVLGVPAILPRTWFVRLPASGEIGARDLLRAPGARVDSVAAAGLADDLDTAGDLAALRDQAGS